MGLTHKIRASYLKYLPWVAYHHERLRQGKPNELSSAIYNDMMNILIKELDLTVTYALENSQKEMMQNVSNFLLRKL